MKKYLPILIITALLAGMVALNIFSSKSKMNANTTKPKYLCDVKVADCEPNSIPNGVCIPGGKCTQPAA